MPPENIRLSRVPPASLYPASGHERPESSPAFSSVSHESNDIEDYIGSGSDTAGGRTPMYDKRLSFSEDRSPNGSPRVQHPHHLSKIDNYNNEEEDDNTDMASLLRNDASRSGQPLLAGMHDERSRERYNRSRSVSPLMATPSSSSHGTPPVRQRSARSTKRSQSPDTKAKHAARRKYVYASIFLVISLVAFCIQTELAAYVQQELGWSKAYCMLYVTHGSWIILWPTQLLLMRLYKWNMPWKTFWKRHIQLVRSTAQMTRVQELDIPRHEMNTSPWPYLIKTTAFVTSALTVAGASWYLAVDMTTPSDLTAIYNCSAFFAYAFSVPLLKEKLRLDKSLAVLLAIAGVLIVAYGDAKPEKGGKDAEKSAGRQFLGNLIIGVGSVLYGLYEVLYKRWACPPEGVSAGRGMVFANTFGSCIGSFTLFVLWIPLPLLHILGWEIFELPTGETAYYLWISVVMNATFAGSFLVLISLTSPVLSSVASLLSIFMVAIIDWLRTGNSMSFAAITGGIMIIIAFLMLSWSTYREMVEDAEHKAAEGAIEEDWESEDDKDAERLD